MMQTSDGRKKAKANSRSRLLLFEEISEILTHKANHCLTVELYYQTLPQPSPGSVEEITHMLTVSANVSI